MTCNCQIALSEREVALIAQVTHELMREFTKHQALATLNFASVETEASTPDEPDLSDTAVALRAIRKLAGLSLDDVSSAAGVSVSYLSRAENNIVTPRSQWIETVVVAIGLEIANRSEGFA